MFAVSRLDPATQAEILIAFNTSTTPLQANVEVDARTRAFGSLKGSCAAQPGVAGSYKVTLEPLSYVICASHEAT